MHRPLVFLAALGLAACSVTLPDRDEPYPSGAVLTVSGGAVTFAARTGPAGNEHGWLRTVAVLHASGPDSTRMEYSGCPVEVQYFRTAGRAGRPAWAQFRVRNFGCPLPLINRTLAPGDSLVLGTVTLPREVLGDSLPVGRYYVAAVLRPNGATVRLPAGEVELAR